MLSVSLHCQNVSPRVKHKVKLENAREAIESYIGSLKKHNETIPEDVGEEVILNA